MPALLLAAVLAGVGVPEPDPAVVAEVRLDVPDAERAELERYVTVRAHQPLDPERIRESVALLYATGRFRDVVVTSQPSPAGPVLVLRPEPAPLLRRVRVEGDGVLDAGDVRRVSGLESREPLWEARLDRAARDVAVALEARGYLEARATARAEEVPAGADAVFTVTAGRRARVSQVELTGLSEADAVRLRPTLHPWTGEPYERERAAATAASLARDQAARGHWRARAEVREAFDPETSTVALVFAVDRGPRTRLEVEGADVPGGLRRRIEDQLRDSGLAADAVDAAVDDLEAHFRSRGYRDARVAPREEKRGAFEVTVLGVTPGPRSEIAAVRVAGAIPEGFVEQVSLLPGGALRDHDLEVQVERLTGWLRDAGYARATVTVDAPEGGGAVDVTFRVGAGPLVTVGSVSIAADVSPPPEASPRKMSVTAGRVYRLADVAHDRAVLLAAYRNAGYLRVDVTPEVTFSEDGSAADIVLGVAAGPRTLVDRIVVAGLGTTREETVRRELAVSEGAPLGIDAVLESQRRLGALGIFRNVEVAELDPESARARDLVVRVSEAPRTTIAYGLGYSERELVRASVEVTRRNLGGLDRALTAFARGSARGSRFLLTYREPHLFSRRQDLFVTGFREEDVRENFAYVRYGGLAQTALRLAGREGTPGTTLILRAVYQETATFDVQVPCDEVDRQFCSATVAGPSASLVGDTRDDPIDPRRGHFLGADVQLSLGALGASSFFKGFVQAAVYQPLGSRIVLGVNGRLGLSRTFGLGESLRLPLPERFFAGGDYSLRGFKVDSVEPEGGNALVLGSAELRVDVGRRFSLAAFGDVGNVYPLTSDLDLGNLRYTAGMGLRYKSAVGPLRIDWGYKLNRRPGESASRFHFTIGHAF